MCKNEEYVCYLFYDIVFIKNVDAIDECVSNDSSFRIIKSEEISEFISYMKNYIGLKDVTTDNWMTISDANNISIKYFLENVHEPTKIK